MTLNEILFDDRSVQPFCIRFKRELTEILVLLSNTEKAYEKSFSDLPEDRPKWVQEFTFMSIESTISATRLLIEGHVNASGNTMRIAYESLCMAILLTSQNPVVIAKGKKARPLDFAKAFEQKHGQTKPYLAVDHVISNAQEVGLTDGSIWLKEAKSFYNAYSHSTLISMNSLMLTGGKAIIGGGYFPEKDEVYSNSLRFITRLLRMYPKIIETIGQRNLTNCLRGIRNA